MLWRIDQQFPTLSPLCVPADIDFVTKLENYIEVTLAEGLANKAGFNWENWSALTSLFDGLSKPDEEPSSHVMSRRLIFAPEMTVARLSKLTCGGKKGHIVKFTYLALENAGLQKASEIKLGSDAERQAHKEAWLAFETLKKERKEAIRQKGNGVAMDGWWCQGSSKDKTMNEEDEVKHEEHAENEAEEGGSGDEDDAMSVVSEGDHDNERRVQLIPPEPVSPMEYTE